MSVRCIPLTLRGGRSHQTEGTEGVAATWTPAPSGDRPTVTGAQAPIFVITVPHSPTSIFMAWAPACPPGTTSQYEISVREGSATGTEIASHTVDGSVFNYTATSLTANTTYWCGVRAIATTGIPLASDWVSQIATTRAGGATITGPVQPLFVICVAPVSTTIRIVWVEPEEIGDTTHWQVVVRDTDATGTVRYNTTHATGTSHVTVTGLTANTVYWCGVQGTDGTGVSGYITQILRTPVDAATPAAPAAPATVTGTAESITFGGTTNHYARIAWTKAAVPGVVTSWRIERLIAVQGNSNWQEIGEVTGADQLAYSDFQVERGVNYSYRVSAIGPGGESAPTTMTGTVNIPAATAPKDPNAVTVTAENEPFGTLTDYYGKVLWTLRDEPGEITGYRIQRLTAIRNSTRWSDLAEVSGSDTLSYNDWTVTRGIDYSYRVAALGPGGTSAYTTGTATANIPASTVSAPKTPATATASRESVTFGGITSYYADLAWTLQDKPGEITSWKIERLIAAQGNTNWQQLGTVTGPGNLSYDDWTVERGVNYSYRVSAVGPGGTSSPKAITGTVNIPAAAAPKDPNAVTVTAENEPFGTLTDYYGKVLWTLRDEPGDITGYKIQRLTAIRNSTRWSDLAEVYGSDTLSYNDWTVTRGIDYSYRVAALGPGGRSAYTAGTATANIPAVPAMTAPKTPATATASLESVTFGGITSYYADLAWTLQDEPGEITSWKIERRIAAQGNTAWQQLGTVTGPRNLSYDDWTVVRGVNYSYRVSAVGPGGTSASKAITGTVDVPATPAIAAPKDPNVVTVARGGVTFGTLTGYYGEVTWTLKASPGVITGYKIQRLIAVRNSTNWLDLAEVSGSGTLRYNDWTVERGINYGYRVAAVGPGGTSTYTAGTATANIPAWTPPSSNLNLTANHDPNG